MRFKDGDNYVNTWHDVEYSVASHLLCKTPAKLMPFLPSPALAYSCPEGWILGNACGEHHCYKIVPVPSDKKARVIEDNYCGEIDKRAIPAIIRCEKENEFLSTEPFNTTAIQTGFALGLYIPSNTSWSPTNFINYDGSKVEYLKWGIAYSMPLKEPNGWKYGFDEKVVVYLMQKRGNMYRKAWHDYRPNAVSNLLCKMPAIGVGSKVKLF